MDKSCLPSLVIIISPVISMRLNIPCKIPRSIHGCLLRIFLDSIYTTYLPMYCIMKLTCFSVDRIHRLWSMICPCLVPLSTIDRYNDPWCCFYPPFIHDFPMVVPLIFRAAEPRGGCALDAAVRSTSWRLWSKCVATRISGNHKRSGAPVR
jgi:hypothetical protein